MSNITSKDTKIEIFVRKYLYRCGIRYRLHKTNLPGKPDIVIPKISHIIFVNGCFWHLHGCKRSNLPKTNTEYWHDKLSKNKQRDLENINQLKKMGWNVTILWECESQNIKSNPLINKIIKEYFEKI